MSLNRIVLMLVISAAAFVATAVRADEQEDIDTTQLLSNSRA
jgi:hypothetical protein